jgi:hypothetical protein
MGAARVGELLSGRDDSFTTAENAPVALREVTPRQQEKPALLAEHSEELP